MSVNMRPRFRYLIEKPDDILCSEFKTLLKEKSNPFTGVVTPNHICINFKKIHQAFFTPHADLTIDSHENGTLVRGLIGPKPQIWTLFAFAHGVSAVLGLAGITIGLSQLGMQKTASALWLLPIAGIISLSTYILAQIGQKMALSQTEELYHFLMDELGHPTHVEWEDL